MTFDFGLGVRFKAAGESDYTIQPVDDAAEQTELLRHMRGRGLDAMPVSLTWQVMTDSAETTGDE